MGKHQEALKPFNHAIRLNPNSSDVFGYLHGLSSAYVSMKQYDKGIQKAKEAIAHAPNYLAPYMTLGSAYLQTGQNEEAVDILKKAIIIDPDNLIAHVGLVLAYSVSSRNAEAKMEAEKIRKLAPNFSAKNFIKKYPQLDSLQVLAVMQKAGLE